MPRSPKRYGLIMENGNMEWSLPESPPSLSRASSVYSTNSDGSTPSTPAEPEVFPGFHFSTSDESVDAADFHRMAARLLGGETQKTPEQRLLDARHGQRDGQLHCNMGRDPTGRHCCSCGRTYSTPFRLSQHIQQCTGNSSFNCPRCDKMFDRRESRDRHVDSQHSKDVCPGCGVSFRPGFLQKHLATNMGCNEAATLQSKPPGSSHSSSRSIDSNDSASPSQKYWIHEGDHSWSGSKRASANATVNDVSTTVDFVKQLMNPMSMPGAQQPCDLCGEMFSTEGDELSRHLGEHSVDFCDKRHKCEECHILFANERDLERHLQSANLIQHCGLTFNHSEEPCPGHHPPSFNARAYFRNDHDSMQRHLWAWENSQLRAHRAKIAGLLASRLTKPIATRRMSVQDCRKTYSALLPHFSMSPSEALPPISEAAEEPEDDDVDEVEAQFCRILSDFFPGENQIPKTKAPEVTHKRSESAMPMLSNRKSLHDLVLRRGTGGEPFAKQHKKSRTLPSLGPLMMLPKPPQRESGTLGLSTPMVPSKLRESTSSASSRPSTMSDARSSVISERPSSVGTDILLTVPYESVAAPGAWKD